jgi:hypothetical protein
MCLTMNETFKALNSVDRLIKELIGLFLLLGVTFVVAIQFPKASLGATQLKAYTPSV